MPDEESQLDLPPACSRLADRELTLSFCPAVNPKSFWKDLRVRIPPTMPVSYAKRKDPTQLSATRYEDLKVPRCLPMMPARSSSHSSEYHNAKTFFETRHRAARAH